MNIKKLYHDLIIEVKKGLSQDINRKIEAVNTGIKPITLDEWKKVPIGTKVITGAYAGTNWITALVEKGENGLPLYTELNTIMIPSCERQVTFDGFVEIMTKAIILASHKIDCKNINTIAISLGFVQRNEKTSIGVDAQFIINNLGKNWEIADFNKNIPNEKQPFLGKLLIHKLRQKGFQNYKYVFFQNDTNSVANYINNLSTPNSLGVGFVFGTGDNASLDTIDLEIGRLDIIPADEIFDNLVKEKIIIDSWKRFEHWMGGHYIKRRLAMDMKLRGEDEIFNIIMNNHDGTILSDIAMGKYKDQLLNKAQAPALRILKETGQYIGTLIAAVIIAAGYKSPDLVVLPVEGGVYWKAYQVKEIAQDTINLLIPNNKIKIISASGIIGVAQAAMVNSISRLH